METGTFDTATIVILAAVLLVGCMAIRSWFGSQKPQSIPDAEKLTGVELRKANASLAQLTTIVQHQQATIDRNAQTLEGMRRSLEDQAGAGKSAIESVSGAVDAARSEAGARDEAMRRLIGDVHGVAVAASENAENALLTAGGLRSKIDEVGDQVSNIPLLRGNIERLEQSVTAMAEAMPKPASEQPPAPAREEQPKPARQRRTATSGRHDKRSTRKTAGTRGRAGRGTPAEEATPAAAEPPKTDAAASAGADPQTGATPPEQPPAATGAPDPEPKATTTPNGETGTSSQQATARANGKPAPASPPAAETTTADAGEAGDGNAADGSGDNHTTTTGAAGTENGDDAKKTPPATKGAAQTEATQ